MRLPLPTGLPLVMEGRERTSEKQSGKTRANKLQKWYSKLSQALPILPQATYNLPRSFPWSGHTLHLGIRRRG